MTYRMAVNSVRLHLAAKRKLQVAGDMNVPQEHLDGQRSRSQVYQQVHSQFWQGFQIVCVQSAVEEPTKEKPCDVIEAHRYVVGS